jgi:hypothetical protein
MPNKAITTFTSLKKTAFLFDRKVTRVLMNFLFLISSSDCLVLLVLVLMFLFVGGGGSNWKFCIFDPYLQETFLMEQNSILEKVMNLLIIHL